MRKPNPEQEVLIRQKTLELLLIKEPEAISMREIASSCGVTATTIYYYYKDKDTLFETIKIECLSAMEKYIILHHNLFSSLRHRMPCLWLEGAARTLNE